MKLTVLGSSSLGNCYILENDNEALIIEAGVKFQEVTKALDFNINKISGCLITHEHGDHSSQISNFLDYSIDVYATPGTLEALEVKHNRAHGIELYKLFNVGDFRIQAFKTMHDASEPCGFLIHHPDTGMILFATDTYYLSHTFMGLNHILIECNYDRMLLKQNIEYGRIPHVVAKRTLESHMEIQTTIAALLANDLTKVNNIVLIHLSDGNSNEKSFKQRIEGATGKNVAIANKNEVFNFSLKPF